MYQVLARSRGRMFKSHSNNTLFRSVISTERIFLLTVDFGMLLGLLYPFFFSCFREHNLQQCAKTVYGESTTTRGLPQLSPQVCLESTKTRTTTSTRFSFNTKKKLNLSTTITWGTEESGRCGEMAVNGDSTEMPALFLRGNVIAVVILLRI